MTHRRPIRIFAIIEARGLTGVARSVLGFAEALRVGRGDPNAFSTSLVISARHAGPDLPLVRSARKAGLRVFVLAERMRYDPGALLHLRELCARIVPDVIQSHAVKSHVLVCLSGLWRHHVWIAFHHGYTQTDVKTRLYNLLDRATLRCADRVVTVAEAFRGDLLRCGIPEARLSVVHNAVAVDASAGREAGDRLRHQLRLPPGTRVLAAVGRLSREKGHLDLIRAFVRVRSKVPQIHLVIAGEGPERGLLEREIALNHLHAQVTLAGEVEDVAAVYGLADALALPSRTEGCPCVLLEAMAAGLPVVATRVGGIPEIASDGRTALLVRVGHIEELASALTRILLDRPLARTLAAEARRHVIERHDPVRRAVALAAIHQAALEARSKRTGSVQEIFEAAPIDAGTGGSGPCAS